MSALLYREKINSIIQYNYNNKRVSLYLIRIADIRMRVTTVRSAGNRSDLLRPVPIVKNPHWFHLFEAGGMAVFGGVSPPPPSPRYLNLSGGRRIDPRPVSTSLLIYHILS
jgi:hypothetical protein